MFLPQPVCKQRGRGRETQQLGAGRTTRGGERRGPAWWSPCCRPFLGGRRFMTTPKGCRVPSVGVCRAQKYKAPPARLPGWERQHLGRYQMGSGAPGLSPGSSTAPFASRRRTGLQTEPRKPSAPPQALHMPRLVFGKLWLSLASPQLAAGVLSRHRAGDAAQDQTQRVALPGGDEGTSPRTHQTRSSPWAHRGTGGFQLQRQPGSHHGADPPSPSTSPELHSVWDFPGTF